MQYNVYINQVKLVEWDLDFRLGALFSFVYESASWAQIVTVGDQGFFWLSLDKILEEMPALGTSKTTIREQMKKLEDKGLIERTVHQKTSRSLFRVTEKGKTWRATKEVAPKVVDQKPVVSKAPDNSVPCPHEKIIAIWGKIMPDKPQPNPAYWRGRKREKELEARWKEQFSVLHSRTGKPLYVDEETGLKWWAAYFQYLRSSAFLMGMRTFDIAWAIDVENFTKAMEGKYHETSERAVPVAPPHIIKACAAVVGNA